MSGQDSLGLDLAAYLLMAESHLRKAKERVMELLEKEGASGAKVRQGGLL